MKAWQGVIFVGGTVLLGGTPFAPVIVGALSVVLLRQVYDLAKTTGGTKG